MKKTKIIAEMAWGHNGSIENAIKIIEGVKSSGADAISIHLTDLKSYMTPNYKCLAGQTLSSSADNTNSIFDYLEKINLSNSDFERLCNHSAKLNIDVVAMCNDFNSFLFSKKLPISKYVISAASFNEYDLIKEIVYYNNDVLLRIGGATLEEIDKIIKFIFSIDDKSRINILAGIQLYPTPVEQLHLYSILSLKERYKNYSVSVGLADHIDGDNQYAAYLPGIALALGAEVLEKHITTNRSEKLEDYEAALGIDQFREFVNYIRTVEKALGENSLDYLTNDSYQKYRAISRKKIVATQEIKANEVITKDKITFKRADEGEPLENIDKIIGKKTSINLAKDDGIILENLV